MEKIGAHWLQRVWGLSKDFIDVLPIPSCPCQGKIRTFLVSLTFLTYHPSLLLLKESTTSMTLHSLLMMEDFTVEHLILLFFCMNTGKRAETARPE